MGTTPKLKFRFPDSTDPADGPLGFNNLGTDVENALALVGSSQSYQRGTQDNFAANVWANVASMTWAAAPAGQYLILATVTISGPFNTDAGTPVGKLATGAAHIKANGGVASQDVRCDQLTNYATTVTIAGLYAQAAAGDLRIDVECNVTFGITTVYKDSTYIRCIYQGPSQVKS